MSVQIDTLGDALPREITRVRDEVLPIYVQHGCHSTATVIRRELDLASKAMIEGDIVAMVQAYESLKGYTV